MNDRAATKRKPWPRIACAAVSVCAAALMPGCATVSQGIRQNVAIDSPDTPSAECTISNRRGKVMAVVTTPGTALLRRGKTPLDVLCKRPGYADARESLVPKFDKRARLQGPPGYLIDAASGAMWRFPDSLTVMMRRIDAAPASSVETPR